MQPVWIVNAALLSLVVGIEPADDPEERKFSECPAAVRKTFQAEAKGVKIETVTLEKDAEGQSVYWADVALDGRTYAIGVFKDGTLSEMTLAVDADEIPFEGCPPAVKATFRSEAFGEAMETVGVDVKYGVKIYEAVVAHKGRSYQIVIAEDGTLVEKTLVIDDEVVELATCPAVVQASFREHAKGGTLRDITHRSAGIGHRTYEASGRAEGEGLPDRGRRKRVIDFQVARSGRGVSGLRRRVAERFVNGPSAPCEVRSSPD